MEEPKCPELEKIKSVSDKSQAIGEFLDWLGPEGYTVCRSDGDLYIPHMESIEKLLAKYFGIDLVKAEQERRALLDYVRANSKEG